MWNFSPWISSHQRRGKETLVLAKSSKREYSANHQSTTSSLTPKCWACHLCPRGSPLSLFYFVSFHVLISSRSTVATDSCKMNAVPTLPLQYCFPHIRQTLPGGELLFGHITAKHAWDPRWKYLNTVAAFSIIISEILLTNAGGEIGKFVQNCPPYFYSSIQSLSWSILNSVRSFNALIGLD